MDIIPGIYKHYKGGVYAVLFTATATDDDRDGSKAVIYFGCGTGEWYSRAVDEFLSPVKGLDGKDVQRYRLVRKFLPVDLDSLTVLKESLHVSR